MHARRHAGETVTMADVPFFIPIPARDLTALERATVLKLLEGRAPGFQAQVAHLQVVGRCGCGQCPTVFFAHHAQGTPYEDLASGSGPDSSGGTVTAVLMHTQGRLTQLEYYPADGHDPWCAPEAQDLNPLP